MKTCCGLHPLKGANHVPKIPPPSAHLPQPAYPRAVFWSPLKGQFLKEGSNEEDSGRHLHGPGHVTTLNEPDKHWQSLITPARLITISFYQRGPHKVCPQSHVDIKYMT